MITGWQDSLASALRKTDRQEFTTLITDLYRSFDTEAEFVAETGAYIASTLYRQEYPRFVPHSYLGFIGAVQLNRYVQPRNRIFPLAQALWYYAQEGIQEPHIRVHLHSGDYLEPIQLKERLEALHQERDFEGFFDLTLSGLRDEDTRDEVIRLLLMLAGQDLFNIGHKYLYLSKALAMMDYLHWENPEIYLFPAIHYLVLAPRDHQALERLEERLAHHGLQLSERSFNPEPLSTGQFMQVRDALLYDTPEGVLDTLLGALDYGVDPIHLVEANLVSAAHLVLSVPYDRWIFSVHGFNFTQALLSTLEYLDPIEQQRLALINGLYLKQAVELASPFRVHEPYFTPRPDAARPRPTELEEAIDLSIPSDAMEILDWLYKRGQLSVELFERLALTAAKNDGDRHFGHDLKFVFATLDAFHTTSTPQREMFLLSLVKFLAESEKSRDLDHSLQQALR